MTRGVLVLALFTLRLAPALEAQTDSVFSGQQLETAPRLIDASCRRPPLADSLILAGASARVAFLFVVDTLGRVEAAGTHILNTDHSAFDAPARVMLRSCRFVPGRRAGRVVRARTQLLLEFR